MINDLEKALIEIAEEAVKAAKKENVPLQDLLDTVKVLTPLYVALKKNPLKSGSDDENAADFPQFAAALAEEPAHGAAEPARASVYGRRVSTDN